MKAITKPSGRNSGQQQPGQRRVQHPRATRSGLRWTLGVRPSAAVLARRPSSHLPLGCAGIQCWNLTLPRPVLQPSACPTALPEAPGRLTPRGLSPHRLPRRRRLRAPAPSPRRPATAPRRDWPTDARRALLLAGLPPGRARGSSRSAEAPPTRRPGQTLTPAWRCCARGRAGAPRSRASPCCHSRRPASR